MARIEPPTRRGPLTRLVHWVGKRKSGGTLPEPFALMAHAPLLMHGYGAFETAFERSKKAPPRLKALAELKASALAGCEWCMDFGSWLVREQTDITEEQLRELPNFRDSDAFTETRSWCSNTPSASPAPRSRSRPSSSPACASASTSRRSSSSPTPRRSRTSAPASTGAWGSSRRTTARERSACGPRRCRRSSPRRHPSRWRHERPGAGRGPGARDALRVRTSALRFEVLEGEFTSTADGEEQVAGPGDKVTVPCNVKHKFENTGPTEGHLRCEIDPGLTMQGFFEDSAALARAGRYTKRGLPSSPAALLDLAPFVERYKDVTVTTSPPPVLQRMAMPALAWLGRRRGRG